MIKQCLLVIILLLLCVKVNATDLQDFVVDPQNFCSAWAEWSESKRTEFIMKRAVGYAQTSPLYKENTGKCVAEMAVGLAKEKKNGKYYLCNEGNNFTAGVILGQILHTSYTICSFKDNAQLLH